jgi:hypothetical protein
MPEKVSDLQVNSFSNSVGLVQAKIRKRKQIHLNENLINSWILF